MQIDGQCHCGKVAYQAEIDPDDVQICHCTDCQALTGSPFRVTAFASRDRVRLTGDAPKRYVRTGDNGNRRVQYFCPNCGSPLFTSGEGADAEQWGIRWGSIRQRQLLAPKQQAWCGSAAPWVYQIGGLPGRSWD